MLCGKQKIKVRDIMEKIKEIFKPNETLSEYKFGHTTYSVKTIYNFKARESLEDVVERLIIRDIEKVS